MSQFAKFAPIAPIATVGLTLGLLLLAAVGCNQSPGLDAKAVAAYRTSFTLAEEPDGVQTVADVRVALLGEPEEDHDHDGDGIQDHAAEDHDEDAHEDHDEDAEHDEDGEDGEDHEGHDEDGEDHEGHNEEHDHEAHEAHDEHDHDPEHEDHAHATESLNVVMVGHIGGLANPWANTRPEFPFAKTQAIFYLADPLAIAENAEHEHTHAPGEECAFCAAHAEDRADMLAVVQFVDEKGNVLPTDVRQLFDVKEKDMVVVSGKARIIAGDILVIDAQGLYIRQ